MRKSSWKASYPSPLREHQWARPRGADECVFERVVDGGRPCGKFPVALGFSRPGEDGDGVGAALDIGEEIEIGAVAPGVPRERLQGLCDEFLRPFGARFAKDLLEDPSHRENGRAGVDFECAGLDLAHLSARLGRPFDDGDLEAARREQQGCDNSANSGADHHDTRRAHYFHLPQQWPIDQSVQMCKYHMTLYLVHK